MYPEEQLRSIDEKVHQIEKTALRIARQRDHILMVCIGSMFLNCILLVFFVWVLWEL